NKTIECERGRTERILPKPHSNGTLLGISDHCASTEQVRMAVQIFCRRMDGDIETEFDRPLDPRRGEGVVGYRNNVVLARDLRDRFEINDFEQRIARRFDPNHSRVLFDRVFEARRVGKIDISKIEVRGTTPNFFEKAKRPAVEIVTDNAVRTSFERI